MRGSASQQVSSFTILYPYIQSVEPRHPRDMQKCSYYLGVCVKLALTMDVTETRFIHTKTKTYSLKATEQYLTGNGNGNGIYIPHFL